MPHFKNPSFTETYNYMFFADWKRKTAVALSQLLDATLFIGGSAIAAYNINEGNNIMAISLVLPSFVIIKNALQHCGHLPTVAGQLIQTQGLDVFPLCTK